MAHAQAAAVAGILQPFLREVFLGRGGLPAWATALATTPAVSAVLATASSALRGLGEATGVEDTDPEELAALWRERFRGALDSDPRAPLDVEPFQLELARAVASSVYARRRQARRRALLLQLGAPVAPPFPAWSSDRGKTIEADVARWSGSRPPASALVAHAEAMARLPRRVQSLRSGCGPPDELFPGAYV